MLLLFYLIAIAIAAHLDFPEDALVTRATKCNGADQVQKDVLFGYISGDKSDAHKTQALAAINLLKNWLNDFPKRQSFKVSNGDVIGYMWVGGMVQNSGFSSGDAMNVIYNEVNTYGIPDLIYIEYVDSDPMKTFGIALNTGGSGKLGEVQKAVRAWSEGKPYNGKTKSKTYSGQTVCYLSYANRKPVQNDGEAGTCDYVRVKSGEAVATTAGVNGESLQGYNPNVNFAALQVGQPICKSVGSLPNFKPSQNSDGSCFTYTVAKGDTCTLIGAYYTLSADNINSFNSKTYQWYGCNSLLQDQKICLSSGSPPRPTSNPKAECGPLAPGDLYNTDCPNNGCCSEYGFCGTTADFCATKQSTTGAPGTTGCFSNCNVGTLPTRKASTYNRVIYWMDTVGSLQYTPSQINSKYNLVHYAFATIGNDFSISVGSGFSDFQKISAKKILTLGGGGGSSSDSIGGIFRTIISTAANQKAFSDKVVKFVNDNNLDGVNFDWEFPSTTAEGKNYADLIAMVKTALRPKLASVSIPATYGGMKYFPLKQLDASVDYFLLMNYDYHGQWDYGTSGIGCHVDRQMTEDSVKIVVKSGIDTTKLYGGLANYARTFKLSRTTCTTYGCSFTGPNSGASTGKVTQTAGIMTEKELLAIPKAGRSRSTDSASHCDIMIYNNGQDWAAWMKDTERDNLDSWYQTIGLGGSAMWLSNYEKAV